MPKPTFKTFDESVIDMLRWYWYRTGTPPDSVEGSVLRTVFEAVGFVNEQLSHAYDQALLDAIPEATFAAFGYQRHPSQRARVTLVFSRTVPVAERYPIPRGTQVRTASGVHFETVQAAELVPGALTVEVPAQAVLAGKLGNTPAGTITQMVNLLPGVERVINPHAAEGGEDEESLSDQAARFSRYLATLAKGTIPALQAAALGVQLPSGERATQVKVVDTYLEPAVPLGMCRVYLYRPGGVSQALKREVEVVLEREQRPVGVVLTVLEIAPRPVSLAVTVHAPSTLVLNAVEEAAYRFFGGLAIGEDVDFNRLIWALTDADPEVYKVEITAPRTHVTVGPYERAELASLTLSYSGVTKR